MKKLVYWILFFVFTGVYFFMIHPYKLHKNFEKGFLQGKKMGDSSGRAEGFIDGVAWCETTQKRQNDSAKLVVEKEAAARSAARRKNRRPKAAPIQNWHVANFQIGEPIVDSPPRSLLKH